MKYFLIIFLGLMPFLSPAQVTIPSDAARYFLEVNEEVKVLRAKDSVQHNLINSFSEELIVKDNVIWTYQQDSISYKIREETLNTKITYTTEENDDLRTQVRKHKTLNNILGILVIIMTLVAL